MRLLGKTYPLTASEFLESGLPGQWDPDMAGGRMRLPIPYTWETELSSTPRCEHIWAWHDLIGMAMSYLRCGPFILIIYFKPLLFVKIQASFPTWPCCVIFVIS